MGVIYGIVRMVLLFKPTIWSQKLTFYPLLDYFRDHKQYVELETSTHFFYVEHVPYRWATSPISRIKHNRDGSYGQTYCLDLTTMDLKPNPWFGGLKGIHGILYYNTSPTCRIFYLQEEHVHGFKNWA